MFYLHTEEGLEIKLSWKERFLIFFKGIIKFNRKSSYQYYNHLMHLISEGFKKYGDAREHGNSYNREKSL